MRPLILAASFLALLAAIVLLVADSAAPCSDFEDVDVSYDFLLTCDGEPYVSGSVRFSNDGLTRYLDATSMTVDWQRETEEDASDDGEEEDVPDHRYPEPEQDGGVDGAGEPSYPIEFLIARTDVDHSNCSPGKGTGVFRAALAEVVALVQDRGERVFSCEVLRSEEAVASQYCTRGEARWPTPNGETEEIDEPFDDCALSLIAAHPLDE